MSWTTDQVLENLKVRGAISSTGALFSSERLLQLMTDEFRSYLMPKVLATRKRYFAWDEDTAINATGIYEIHTRALSAKLDNVALIDASPTPTRRLDLDLLDEDELVDYGAPALPGTKPGVYIKRNTLYLVPPTGHGYSYFRQTFFLRPGDFVLTTSAAQVTAINTGTRVVTFSTVPSDWTTSNVFDFIQQNPHFDTLAISKAISAITTGASGTLTFSASLPDRLAVGDWVCLAGQTCIVQAPESFHPLLERRVANICLGTLGKASAVEAGEKDLAKMEKAVVGLVSPRVEKEAAKLVNRSGMLRRG